MGYAYIDKAGILHVVAERKTAEEYAAGKVVETNLPFSGGYPLHGSKDVTMYSEDLAYLGGNARSGRKVVPEEDIPEILALYKSCK